MQKAAFFSLLGYIRGQVSACLNVWKAYLKVEAFKQSLLSSFSLDIFRRRCSEVCYQERGEGRTAFVHAAEPFRTEGVHVFNRTVKNMILQTPLEERYVGLLLP